MDKRFPQHLGVQSHLLCNLNQTEFKNSVIPSFPKIKFNSIEGKERREALRHLIPSYKAENILRLKMSLLIQSLLKFVPCIRTFCFLVCFFNSKVFQVSRRLCMLFCHRRSKGASFDSFFFFLVIYLFIWLYWVLPVACGIQFLGQGSNLGPLLQEHQVLATGTPRKFFL